MNYYNEIKQELINNEISKKVKNYSINRSDLTTYYNVGKMLNEAGKHYGEGIIKDYSKKLTEELGKGYSKRNLWLMLRFYQINEKMQTVSAQLSWSQQCELLSIESVDEILSVIVEVLDENEDAIKTYKNGRTNIVDYLVGQVMKKTNGKATPSITRSKMIEEIEKRQNILSFFSLLIQRE